MEKKKRISDGKKYWEWWSVRLLRREMNTEALDPNSLFANLGGDYYATSLIHHKVTQPHWSWLAQ